MDLLRVFAIGFNLAISFILQIALGVLLCWIYTNAMNAAFVTTFCHLANFESGFMVRSFHINGTSLIFILLYYHIFKVLYIAIAFDSSHVTWSVGFILLLLIIVIAFLGYVLPLTQMSYWGLTVFSNILSSIPYLGPLIISWFWSGEFINDNTLLKVHSIHILAPVLSLFIILLHLVSLHYYLSSDSLDRYAFYTELEDRVKKVMV